MVVRDQKSVKGGHCVVGFVVAQLGHLRWQLLKLQVCGFQLLVST